MQILDSCNKLNEPGTAREINCYLRVFGYKLRFCRSDQYWYFSPLHDHVVQIDEQGLYGWSADLKVHTIASVIDQLLTRIRAQA